MTKLLESASKKVVKLPVLHTFSRFNPLHTFLVYRAQNSGGGITMSIIFGWHALPEDDL